MRAKSCATKPPVSLDSSGQGSAAAFGNHCQGNAVPFGILCQQGAPRPYSMPPGQRTCRPFGFPARFEMRTHKRENGLWAFLSKRKNPQTFIQMGDEVLWIFYVHRFSHCAILRKQPSAAAHILYRVRCCPAKNCFRFLHIRPKCSQVSINKNQNQRATIFSIFPCVLIDA